jgi:hypothetical protein
MDRTESQELLAQVTVTLAKAMALQAKIDEWAQEGLIDNQSVDAMEHLVNDLDELRDNLVKGVGVQDSSEYLGAHHE